MFRRIASLLPSRFQQELKRQHYARRIRTGRFSSGEPEYAKLGTWVRPGDWVLDVGANVGYYCARLSQLVGPNGRVVAFEPVPQTFELLAANMARCAYRNVTLLNFAASSQTRCVGMSIPMSNSHLRNYYRAQCVEGDAEFSVLSVTVDSLELHRIAFGKIDVEGHEISVLEGMRELIERDRPVLIVEGRSTKVDQFLSAYGYRYTENPHSPNRVFEPGSLGKRCSDASGPDRKAAVERPRSILGGVFAEDRSTAY